METTKDPPQNSAWRPQSPTATSGAALAMVKRYGDDAMLEASERADQLLDEGNMAGAETWHRILNAIERLQAAKPAEGEAVH